MNPTIAPKKGIASFMQKPFIHTLASLVILLLIGLIVYSPFANQFGYYRDDWHVVWGWNVEGIQSVIRQHSIDRPLQGYTYGLAYDLIGDNLPLWNAFAITLRIFSAWLFFWIGSLLWKKQKTAVSIMALFFLIYPGFLQLPNANTYQNHLFALNMGLLSLALSLQMVKTHHPALKSILGIGAALSSVVCYLIFEWMVGFEIVRLFLMGFIFLKQNTTWRKKALDFTLHWLPCLLSFSGFLYWRMFKFESLRSVTDVGALKQRYLADPAGMLLRLLVEIGRDFWDTFYSAWAAPFYNLSFRANYTDLILAVLIGLGAVILFFGFVNLLQRYFNSDGQDPSISSSPTWTREAIILGLLSLLISLAPAILADREVRFEDALDRYTLTPMFGACLLLGGLIFSWVNPKSRHWVVAILLFTATITQITNGINYKNWWAAQTQFWWQTKWRIPEFKEGTVLVASMPDAFQFSEDYEVWAPANLIYFPGVSNLGILGDTLNSISIKKIQMGLTDQRTMRTIWQERNYRNTLVLSQPSTLSCLHVIDSSLAIISEYEPSNIYQAMPYSNASQIIPNNKSPNMKEAIFGAEPTHTWCYYYQKADLARQTEEWTEIMSILNEVHKAGFQPNDPYEWTPFLIAALETGSLSESKFMLTTVKENEWLSHQVCRYFESPARLKQLPESSVSILQETICSPTP